MGVTELEKMDYGTAGAPAGFDGAPGSLGRSRWVLHLLEVPALRRVVGGTCYTCRRCLWLWMHPQEVPEVRREPDDTCWTDLQKVLAGAVASVGGGGTEMGGRRCTESTGEREGEQA